MAPASPRLRLAPHTPFLKCGLLMGVAAGLGEGQGGEGQRACVTQGPGRDGLSLLSRKQMQTVGLERICFHLWKISVACACGWAFHSCPPAGGPPL